MWEIRILKGINKVVSLFFMLFVLGFIGTNNVWAGEADVIKATVECEKTCTFIVTVAHADEGWAHYANRWEVLTLDGEVIATRVLGHPHVNEQPFTRALSDVKIPKGIKEVIIRAHDSVHLYGGKEFKVKVYE